jgi:hypothetical protein
MPRGATITFATIECDRCGGIRILTQPCADCGRLPRSHETQPKLERRRKVLADFRASSFETPIVVATEFDDALEELAGLHRRVTDALADIARGGTSPDALIEGFGQFDARVAHWARRQPRPYTNRGRGLGKALALWREGLGVYATAFEAPTVLAAQECEREGQRLIDAARDEIDGLREITESEALLEAPDGFGGIGAAARALAGGDAALDELDARLQAIGGREKDSSATGLGLQLHLFRQIMLALLDLEECLDVERIAERQFGNLALIAADTKWQARTGVVTAQFSSAAFNLSNIDGASDLEAASMALHLVMQCRDGVIRHCLATLLAENASDFHKLERKGTGFVLKRSAQLYPGLRLNENLSPILRHAGAHFDYDIDGTDFITHTGSGEEIRLTFAEFMDAFLGYVQTSISLLMALLAATAVQAIDLEISRHTPERDLLGIMAMMAGFLGFEDATVVRDGETLVITATGDAQQLATAVAGMATFAPEPFTSVVGMIAQDDGTIRTWQAPLSAFRDYLGRPTGLSEIDNHMAIARLMSTVRIDSRPVWGEEIWLALGHVVVTRTGDLPLRERVGLVREVRSMAAVNEQIAVSDYLSGCLKELREGTSETAMQPSPFARGGSVG